MASHEPLHTIPSQSWNDLEWKFCNRRRFGLVYDADQGDTKESRLTLLYLLSKPKLGGAKDQVRGDKYQHSRDVLTDEGLILASPWPRCGRRGIFGIKVDLSCERKAWESRPRLAIGTRV